MYGGIQHMASLTTSLDDRSKLIKFSKLLGAKAYDKFLNNVRDIGCMDLSPLLNYPTPSGVLNYAFVWEESPEGHDYWCKIDDRLKGITFYSEPTTTKDYSTGTVTAGTTPQRTKSVLELAYEDTERQRQEIINRLRGIT
jgi:hypothetical protein